MNPRIKDVVGFIGRYITDHWESYLDRDEISDELLDRGYSSSEITDAFHWIDEMTLGALRDAMAQETVLENTPSQRVLSAMEAAKLSSSAWDSLVGYYNRGLVSPPLLEEIIDRCMQLEVDEVSSAQAKDMAALTLFKHLHDEWKEFLHSSSTLLH